LHSTSRFVGAERQLTEELSIQIIATIGISDVVVVLQNNTEQGRSVIGTSLSNHWIPVLIIVSLISGEKDLVGAERLEQLAATTW